MDEVKLAVEQDLKEARQENREPTPEFQALQSQLRHQGNDTCGRGGAVRLKRMDIVRLTDSPPIAVPASPWTSVVRDDGLVSHLVSVFFTWEYPFHNWFNIDMFISDMRKGEPDASFCTPFLVNALLAMACPYSDYEEVLSGTSESSLMHKFIAEAKRLLDSEDEPTITKLQGLCFLFLAVSVIGLDADGRQYMQLIVETYPLVMNKPGEALNDSESTSVDLTCWGIFNIHIMGCHVWQMAPALQEPARSMPSSTRDTREWTPYPFLGQSRNAYIGELAHHLSHLSLISRDISTLLYTTRAFRPSDRHQVRQIHVLRARLLKWRENLPSHLLVGHDTSTSILTHQYD
jgi:hypothetical protein